MTIASPSKGFAPIPARLSELKPGSHIKTRPGSTQSRDASQGDVDRCRQGVSPACFRVRRWLHVVVNEPWLLRAGENPYMCIDSSGTSYLMLPYNSYPDATHDSSGKVSLWSGGVGSVEACDAIIFLSLPKRYIAQEMPGPHHEVRRNKWSSCGVARWRFLKSIGDPVSICAVMSCHMLSFSVT